MMIYHEVVWGRGVHLRFIQGMVMLLAFVGLLSRDASAGSLKVGDDAPLFSLVNQNGELVSLADRRGKGWTVLFFYPKAGTPGCRKEVCAYRDAIREITALNAVVYGISVDTVQAQKEFHAEEQLTFDLLADPEGEVVTRYGAKMPLITVARRWTFIIDPELKIRAIHNDVDPATDARRAAEALRSFQEATPLAQTSALPK